MDNFFKLLTDEKIIELAEKSRQWVNNAKNRPQGADHNLYGNAYNKYFAKQILDFLTKEKEGK